ncbi:MAG: hypothetical protein CMF22_11750 [Idiomarinaceae bacterium]|nr:hypothetical protein [Idiomarinaceae bacterium]|tara:strand:+ start:46530 stop:47261 length:732 start_codon:yes stop_codon:yes gene_type:complete
MSNLYPYRYGAQFERFLSQFARVLSGFQVRDGVKRDGDETVKTRRVPVVYGSMSRVVAQLLNDRDFLSNRRVPMMAFNLDSLEIDQEAKRNVYHVDEVSYKTADGTHASYSRAMGPAFIMNVSVSIYASSNTELFSILEQILLVFNPRVSIQTDNSVFNQDYISDITLEGINNEVSYPLGTDQRVVEQTLNFSLPVRLSYPVDLSSGIIERIRMRIFDDSTESLDMLEEIIIPEGANFDDIPD